MYKTFIYKKLDVGSEFEFISDFRYNMVAGETLEVWYDDDKFNADSRTLYGEAIVTKIEGITQTYITGKITKIYSLETLTS